MVIVVCGESELVPRGLLVESVGRRGGRAWLVVRVGSVG